MTSLVSTPAPVSRGSQEPTAKSVSVLCNGMCGHSEISKCAV